LFYLKKGIARVWMKMEGLDHNRSNPANHGDNEMPKLFRLNDTWHMRNLVMNRTPEKSK
jgi:hypothetical protein